MITLSNKSFLYIKILIILVFITGLLQWDIFDIKWKYFTLVQATHIIGSLIIFIFFIIPFTTKHIYKYFVIEKILNKNGILLLILLLFISISGLYLFFVGNRGGDIIGIICFNIHLYGSFIFLSVFIYHVRYTIISLALLSIVFPTISYSDINKFTLMKLEDNKTSYHIQDWTNSTKCKSCHSDIFNQWADSNHKNMTDANPYYMVLETLAAQSEGEEFRQWCMGCHNPSALTLKRSKTTHSMNGNILDNAMFEKGAKTLIDNFKTHPNSRLEEGVSCIACHRITKTTTKGNGSFTLNLTDRKKYSFEDTTENVTNYLSEKFINSKPKIHKMSYSNPLYKKSSYCASCHEEFLPNSNSYVVSTFKEWEQSPYNNPKNPKKHKTCIDCHMRYLHDNKFAPLKGRSTDGGEIKDDIKVHYFSGSNHFLSGLKSKIHEDQTLQLLKTAAKVNVKMKNKQLLISVTNVGAGHHLPTGVADFRELWLDVSLKDKNGKIILSSGKLDKSGNLEKNTRAFIKVFGDEFGKPVGLLFWKYKKILKDTRIPAKKTRVEIYDIDTLDQSQYPLTVVVKLNFRIYPQWVSDFVRKIYPTLPNPPVVELQKISKTFN